MGTSINITIKKTVLWARIIPCWSRQVPHSCLSVQLFGSIWPILYFTNYHELLNSKNGLRITVHNLEIVLFYFTLYSPSEGACCESSCTPRPSSDNFLCRSNTSSLASSYCDGTTACPSSVSLPDGANCDDDMVCLQGVCLVWYQVLKILLKGEGAKQPPLTPYTALAL